MRKIEVDKDLLYKYYIEENHNIQETADLMKISYRTIQRAVKQYNFNKDNKQIQKQRKEALLEKYGVENTYQLDSSKEKSKQTKLERYGDENYNNSDLQKQTMMNMYGVKCGYNLLEVQEKIIEKYGGIGRASKIISDKMNKTIKERYGVDYPIQNKEIRLKAKKSMIETNIKRYGVKYNLQSIDIKDKIKETNMKKYGVPYFCMKEECYSKNGSTVSKVNKSFAKLLDNNSIQYEMEYHLGLKSYDFKIDNILIEINPTYTHNSTNLVKFHNTTREPCKYDYHIEKTKLALDNGYRCIHIWDWDNIDKIIEILKPKESIYARNCSVKEIQLEECNDFLNKYHLQNTCKGQDIRLGLYYNNELIELMTFGKPRYNKRYDYELLRLCTKSSYKITGGASKLFKYFIKNYQPKSIISYCDNSKFSGEIYKNLGFILKDFGGPSKHWFNGEKHITDNLLRQRGFDQLFNMNYGKGTSNEELMKEYGFVEIYDSGQSTYIWNYK